MDFFEVFFHEIYNFVQSDLITCLVQLLRVTFHEMLHFKRNIKYFLSLLF